MRHVTSTAAAVVVAVVVPVVGCGGDDADSSSNGTPVATTRPIISIVETDADGTRVADNVAELPEGFPSSVPLPAGLAITYRSSTSASDQTWGVAGEIVGAPTDVIDEYVAQLEAAGFEQVVFDLDGDSAIMSYDDGVFVATAAIGPLGDGSQFNLNVQPSASGEG